MCVKSVTIGDLHRHNALLILNCQVKKDIFLELSCPEFTHNV